MDIGTDKIPRGVRETFPHHLIDVVRPDEVFTVVDFRRRAEVIIDRLHREGKLPIVCGGTGLYIKALTSGIFPGPGRDEKLREDLRLKIKEKGLSSLYRELRKVDPASAERIHPNDEVRIIRALEVYFKTGVSISNHQQKKTFPPSWKMIAIGLCWRERSVLYGIIEQRVDRMLERGLVGEVQKLLDAGYQEGLSSMQALGYQQIIGYLNGRLSFDEAVARVKRDTRRFAKRQLSWLRREENIIWLERENYRSSEGAANRIIDILMEKVPEARKILPGT